MSWLTGGILRYSFHIGKFESQRRLGRRQAIIEVKKESRIGTGFNLGLDDALQAGNGGQNPLRTCVCMPGALDLHL